MTTKVQATALRWAREQHSMRKGRLRGIYPNNDGIRANGGGSYRRMVERMAKDGLLAKTWPFHITDEGRRALTEFETRQWWNGHHYQAKAPHEC